jgi:hypothetical protein
MDPDPGSAIFASDLQDAYKKRIVGNKSFSAYYFF